MSVREKSRCDHVLGVKFVKFFVWWNLMHDANKHIYLICVPFRLQLTFLGNICMQSLLYWIMLFDLPLAATCFSKSPLQAVISLLEFMPESLQVSLPYILNLLKGFLSLWFTFYFVYLLVEIHSSFSLGKLNFFSKIVFKDFQFIMGRSLSSGLW